MKYARNLLLALSLMVAAPAWGNAEGGGEPASVSDAAAPAGVADAGATTPTAVDTGAVAPVAPTINPNPLETVEGATEMVNVLIDASQKGHWSLVLGAFLSLLVWFLNRLIGIKDKVGKKALPWVVAGLGVAASIAFTLLTGAPLGAGLVQGFLTGAAAVGLWELVLKHVLKKEEEPKAKPTPEPAA